MNKKLQVVVSDLDAAARAFRHSADEMASVPQITSMRVDSGDPALDRSIHTALRMVQGLHFAGAHAIADTSNKLTDARKAYEQTDVTVRELYDDVLKVDLGLSGSH